MKPTTALTLIDLRQMSNSEVYSAEANYNELREKLQQELADNRELLTTAENDLVDTPDLKSAHAEKLQRSILEHTSKEGSLRRQLQHTNTASDMVRTESARRRRNQGKADALIVKEFAQESLKRAHDQLDEAFVKVFALERILDPARLSNAINNDINRRFETTTAIENACLERQRQIKTIVLEGAHEPA